MQTTLVGLQLTRAARLEHIQQVLRAGGELARQVDRLHGIAVTPAAAPDTVMLWFLVAGCWQQPAAFSVAATEGQPRSMDQRLRELFSTLRPERLPARQRQEHLGLLVRWFHSSWRDGEWLSLEAPQAVPYRKLVNAIHRVAAGARSAV